MIQHESSKKKKLVIIFPVTLSFINAYEWIFPLYKMRGKNRPANTCTSAVYAHELKRSISFIHSVRDTKIAEGNLNFIP